MKIQNILFFQIFFILIIKIYAGKLKLRVGEKIKNSGNDPYNINEVTEIYYAEGKCTSNNCDNCLNATICQCPYGYAQDPKKKFQIILKVVNIK